MPGAYDQKSIEFHFAETNRRLREAEAQIARLSEHAGIDYELPNAEVPQEVVDLAQSGKVLEAMKLYREQTGADADTARTVVGGL